MTFYQPEKLPKLMVAPNGARKVKKDHPAVPLTIDFDTGRIVTTLAVHRNFNWMKIAHAVIKKGK